MYRYMYVNTGLNNYLCNTDLVTSGNTARAGESDVQTKHGPGRLFKFIAISIQQEGIIITCFCTAGSTKARITHSKVIQSGSRQEPSDNEDFEETVSILIMIISLTNDL